MNCILKFYNEISLLLGIFLNGLFLYFSVELFQLFWTFIICFIAVFTIAHYFVMILNLDTEINKKKAKLNEQERTEALL